MRVTKNGSLRWKTYYWVYISRSLADKYVAAQELGNEVWKVFCRNVFLGYFNEKLIREKQQSIRLATNIL